MSLQINPANTTVSQGSRKSGVVSKLFAPLVLGTAIALSGGGGTARAVDENKPEGPVPVQVKEEEKPAAENPKPDNPAKCTGRFALGYVSGVIMEKLLASWRNKREGQNKTT